MCLSSYDADSQMHRTWKSSACMAWGSQQRDLISTKSLPPLIVATFHSALIHQLMEIQRVVLRVESNLWMVMDSASIECWVHVLQTLEGQDPV
jgi:hypothetical protein